MGQQTSIFDFRETIVALKSYDAAVSATDHAFWKPLFLTSMTHDEICAMLNFDDVRELRLFYTDRLAMLVYKCLEQLHQFVHNAASVSDYCSVDNALRMLGHMLPFLFEDSEFAFASLDKTKEEKGSARSLVITQREMNRLASRKRSVFGPSFAQSFFWDNKTCAGLDVEKCEKISWAGPLQHHFASISSVVPPLGQILCQTLMKLCFIPGFTLYPTQAVNADGSLSQGLVDRGALWFGAAPSSASTLVGKTVALATVAQATVDRRRVDVLKALLQTMYSSLCSRGRVNLFFSCLTSTQLCPEIPTLCMGLLHCISHYHTRGILPYTSHIGAELPELLLSLAMELLVVVDDTVAKALLRPQEAALLLKEHHNASFNDAAAEMALPPNGWISTLMKSFQEDAEAARLLSISITTILENPLYASRTWLKGSQKVVDCQSEALLLLLRLLDDQSFLADFSSTLLANSINALLYFVQEGTKSNVGFNDVQLSLFALLKLSASRGFVYALSESVTGPIALSSIPPLAKGSPPYSLMDLLLLGLCEMMSPMSPRWYIPLIPTAATIVCNLATGVEKLHETTCFELASSMSFMSHRNVLAKGLPMQQSCQLLVEAAVTMMHRRPRGTVFLLAHLAIGDFATGLRHVQESAPPVQIRTEPSETAAAAKKKNMETREETTELAPIHVAADDANAPSRPQLPLPSDFFVAMPLDELETLLEKAKRYLEAQNAAPSGSAAGALLEGQLQLMLDSAEFSGELAMPAGSCGHLTVRQFHLSAPIAKYLTMQTWRTIHRRNLRPPIFDFSAAKFEFEEMHKY